MQNSERISRLKDDLRLPLYESFPDIELYMDQVLDYLSRSRSSLRDDDKLSSAMVNNYIKAELLPRARGKKYSREHLAHLSIIMRLKQVLSVKDTGKLISAYKENKSDEELFNSFREIVEQCTEQIVDAVISSDDALPEIAMYLAVQSYLSKVGCEYIIDQIIEEEYGKIAVPPKKEKGEKPE